MIKCIINPRAAAVAFAASALVAAPALADPGKGHKYKHPHASSAVQFDVGNGLSLRLTNGKWSNNYYGRRSHSDYYGNRHYGYQDHYRTKQLRRDAVRLCAQAVRYKSDHLGFRRVHLEEVERIKQIGPRGFIVRAEFEFDGRRGDFDRDVTCTVRRGRVVDIDHLPRARGHRDRNYRYQGYGDSNYGGRGHRNNDHLKGGKHYGN